MSDCYLAIKASLKMNDNSNMRKRGTKGVSGGGADRQAAPEEIDGCEERRRRRGERTMKRGGDLALSSSRSK